MKAFVQNFTDMDDKIIKELKRQIWLWSCQKIHSGIFWMQMFECASLFIARPNIQTSHLLPLAGYLLWRCLFA